MKTLEHGIARCPRCMALTDYTFFDRGDDMLLYEVRCTTCANVYTELTDMPAAPAVTAA